MAKENNLTALEILKDMGFQILNMNIDKENSNRKISIDVQFYEDGSWVVDSNDSTGLNTTLNSGTNLVNILPILKECRNTFLKAISELDKK